MFSIVQVYLSIDNQNIKMFRYNFLLKLSVFNHIHYSKESII